MVHPVQKEDLVLKFAISCLKTFTFINRSKRRSIAVMWTFVYANITAYITFGTYYVTYSKSETVPLIGHNCGIFLCLIAKLTGYISNGQKLHDLLSTVCFRLWSLDIAGPETKNDLMKKGRLLDVFGGLYLSAVVTACYYLVVPLSVNKFPGFVNPSDLNDYLFVLLYSWQVVICLFVFVMHAFTELASFKLLWIVGCQFDLLGIFFERSMEDVLSDKYESELKERRLIKAFVIYHLKLTEVCEKLRDALKMMCLTLWMAIIPTFIWDIVIITSNVNLLSFISILYIAIIFLYCYLADDIITKSTNLANVIYNTEWYRTSNRSFRKSLLILTCRTQKPSAMVVGGVVPLHMGIFVSTLKAIYSTYSLLRLTLRR